MDAADRVGEQVRFLRSPLRVKRLLGVGEKWVSVPDILQGAVGRIQRHHNGRVKVVVALSPNDYYVTNWIPESEIISAEPVETVTIPKSVAFVEPIDPVASQPRKLIAMLELNTYGTEEQMWKSYEKLKFELNLQGFKFILSDEIQVRP